MRLLVWGMNPTGTAGHCVAVWQGMLLDSDGKAPIELSHSALRCSFSTIQLVYQVFTCSEWQSFCRAQT